MWPVGDVRFEGRWALYECVCCGDVVTSLRVPAEEERRCGWCRVEADGWAQVETWIRDAERAIQERRYGDAVIALQNAEMFARASVAADAARPGLRKTTTSNNEKRGAA